MKPIEAIAYEAGVLVSQAIAAAAALGIQPAGISSGWYSAEQSAVIGKHLSESKNMSEDQTIVQEFANAVTAKQQSAVAAGRRPLSHGQATHAVCREQPELRQAYVAASNRLAGNKAAANVTRIQAAGEARVRR